MKRVYAEPEYRAALELLRRSDMPCCHCGARRATSPDHVPPLADHVHTRVGDCCALVPACAPCNLSRGAATGNRRRRAVAATRLLPGSGWAR